MNFIVTCHHMLLWQAMPVLQIEKHTQGESNEGIKDIELNAL